MNIDTKITDDLVAKDISFVATMPFKQLVGVLDEIKKARRNLTQPREQVRRGHGPVRGGMDGWQTPRHQHAEHRHRGLHQHAADHREQCDRKLCPVDHRQCYCGSTGDQPTYAGRETSLAKMAEAAGCEWVIECPAEETGRVLKEALETKRMTVLASKYKSGNAKMPPITMDPVVIRVVS